MRRAEPTPADERAGGVLVIGGAGFVGSHLVERLIAEGGTVDVVDDLSTGSLANLADARTEAARLDASELHIHTLDACSDDLATMIAMRRPREIYHLALLPRHDASAGRPRPLVHVDARCARRGQAVRRDEGGRRPAGDGDVRAPVGAASSPSRKARWRRAACAAWWPRRSSSC